MINPKRQPSSLARLNLVLVVLIFGINLYIFVSPLLPEINLWLRRRHSQSQAGLPYKTQLDTNPTADQKRSDIPTDNRLVIPKLALDEHVYEGSNPYIVNKGVWARPKTSTPPKGSNTVLVAHRFTYHGPATFYSLDKVAVDDTIVIYWAGKEYDYKVTSNKVVPPSLIEVEDPTQQPQLTLYTCTPLWSAKNRLVVTATLINQEQSNE